MVISIVVEFLDFSFFLGVTNCCARLYSNYYAYNDVELVFEYIIKFCNVIVQPFNTQYLYSNSNKLIAYGQYK